MAVNGRAKESAYLLVIEISFLCQISSIIQGFSKILENAKVHTKNWICFIGKTITIFGFQNTGIMKACSTFKLIHTCISENKDMLQNHLIHITDIQPMTYQSTHHQPHMSLTPQPTNQLTNHQLAPIHQPDI